MTTAVADAPAATAAKGKSKKKLIIFIAAPLVLLGAAYFLLGGKGGDDAAAVEEPPPLVEGPVVEADEMLVTLGDEGTTRYARLRFGLVLPEGGDATVITDKMPLLKDGVLDVMAGFTATELQGAKGLRELRTKLMTHAETVWPDDVVMRVVITELVVQ